MFFSEGIATQISKLKIQVHPSSSGFSTKDFLLRFPTIGEEIFDQLDHENLVKCRLIGSFWCSVIDNSKIVWRRRIQIFNENHVEFHQHWKSVLKNIPRDRIKELALAAEQFYSKDTDIRRLDFNHSPLHITSACGFFSLHKFVTEKILAVAPISGIISKVANLVTKQSSPNASNEINPMRKDGVTPVHFAATYGHVDLFMYLADHLEDIFPLTKDGTSPLVCAAQNGHLVICKTIVERAKEPNLGDTLTGLTPLHTASYNGHFDICQLLIENIDDKNPRNKNGNTPLHFAAEQGHFEIYKLIFENIKEKNPASLNGQTPLGLAGNNGRFRILKYAGIELANED